MKPWNIEICDVTLRDGEQTPGVTFSCDEKMEIAGHLDAIGVEVIEAGFPVVSQDEKRCVTAVARAGLDARICCLARAVREDVEAAITCGVDMVSIFVATSDLHIRHKYRKPRDEVIAGALEMIELAKDHGLQVRFAAEDASRTDPAFLKEVYRQGITHGADLVSFADTVGCLTPTEIHGVVSYLVPDLGRPLCIHCHNDLGCASANTITAAEAGAFQLHTTVNGIGERAGNAALEEVLTAAYMKGGVRRYDLGRITEISRCVERISGIKIAKNKAVVGDHAFCHESGIHIAAMLEEPRTYEFIPPELVGAERRFVLGKHTGMRALKHVLRTQGYDLSDAQVRWVLEEVKTCSEGKCCVTPEVLCSIIRRSEEEGLE